MICDDGNSSRASQQASVCSEVFFINLVSADTLRGGKNVSSCVSCSVSVCFFCGLVLLQEVNKNLRSFCVCFVTIADFSALFYRDD